MPWPYYRTTSGNPLARSTSGSSRASSRLVKAPADLLLKHTQSDISIDVILGGLPFEQEAVRRASTHRVGEISIRRPRVEDLVIMKVIAPAGRPGITGCPSRPERGGDPAAWRRFCSRHFNVGFD